MSDILELERRIQALEDWQTRHCSEDGALEHYHEHDIEDSAIDVSGAVEEHLAKAADEIEAAIKAEEETEPPPDALPAPAPPEPPREEIEPKREHFLHRKVG